MFSLFLGHRVSPVITQLLILTRIHYGLPLAAPLAELLGILFLHLCPLHEAGHDVVAGLEGLIGPVHCAHIIPRLGGRKVGDDVRE